MFKKVFEKTKAEIFLNDYILPTIMANVVIVEQVHSPLTWLCEKLLQDEGHRITKAGIIHPQRAEDIGERVRLADVVVLATTSHVTPPERRQGFYEELRVYGKPIVVADTNLCEPQIAVVEGDTYINTFSERHSVHKLLPEAVSSLAGR